MAEELEELGYGKIIRTEKGESIVRITKTKFIKITSKILEELPDFLFVEGNWLINEDVIPENMIVLGTFEKMPKFQKELVQHIPSTYSGALSFASHILRLEGKGVDTEEEYEKLYKAYGGLGIRLYSLLASGLLQREIKPLLDQEDVTSREIQRHIDSLIRSPGAIFVSRRMEKEDIIEEIKEKLTEKDKFKIFARSERLVEATKEALREIDEEILYRIEKGKLGANIHIEVDVIKPESLKKSLGKRVSISLDRASKALRGEIINKPKIEGELTELVSKIAKKYGVELKEEDKKALANLSYLAAKKTSGN